MLMQNGAHGKGACASFSILKTLDMATILGKTNHKENQCVKSCMRIFAFNFSANKTIYYHKEHHIRLYWFILSQRISKHLSNHVTVIYK